ncbi:MAG: nicotinate (nicotinamide) nucleotide adenylyltransferase [Gracilimonas sp.]|uniref:nicotinate (nicotinamide) nucleotide adenylyltransferase n=1 Tax=Gracilimonas sp. TaxID=1974203 RepID=UPI003750DBD9|nr:nicotinate (nicotinamide) nucleotide adenylyltransferase [Gracilimonas sp.]
MAHRVGLFGGTFDPVHNGHVSIAQSFLDSGNIDELWVLLTPYPPHKQEKKTTSYQTRLDMLEAAFAGMEKVKINTIENSLPKPSYSVQTIRYLKKEYPDTTFFYCMGEDSLAKFHTWKFYDEILEECDLLVAQRPGVFHEETQDDILAHTRFVPHTPLDISSSDIRDEAKKGKSIQNMVPEEVALIIENEQLYS